MSYKTGLFVGRFQPFHRGHERVVRKMLEECETIIIAIGSAQEFGTEKNPFRYEYRRNMIQKTFPEYFNRIIILGVADRKNPSEDETWGEYLLSTIYRNTLLRPEIIYQGFEDKHTHWFDSSCIDIVNIDRSILNVSATDVRKTLFENNFEEYRKLMPEALLSEFKTLRMGLKNVKSN